MKTDRPTVFIVDDEPAVLRSLQRIIEQAGHPVCTYASSSAFLEDCPGYAAGCLVLDLCMPGMDGMAVLEHLAARGIVLPTIIVTGAGDVRKCAGAFKMGVGDFLEKPVDEEELLGAVHRALDRLAEMPPPSSELTGREQEVLALLVAGKSLKEIAALGKVSVQSVWKHQRRILEKFGVENEVELVRRMLRVPSKGS